MLTLVLAIKLIAEIALLALLGQWVLGLLLGASAQANPFYGLLQLVGRPWVLAVRWLLPRSVAARHVPVVAFFGVLALWVAVSIAKVKICLQIGVALCK